MAKSKTEALSGNNLLIVMVLISLLVVGVTALIAKTLVTSIIRDTKVVSASAKADKQLTENLEAAPQLVTAYEALGREKEVLANALPNTADFPGLIVLMENIATDAGVRLKTVSPSLLTTMVTGSETTEGAAETVSILPKTYAFTVTFDGSYESMRKLMSNLEASARPMRVVGLQLNGSGAALSGELSLETYYQDKAVLPFTKEVIK